MDLYMPIEANPLPGPAKPLLLRVAGRCWPFMVLAAVAQVLMQWAIPLFATTERVLVAWKVDLMGWLFLGSVLVLAMFAGWTTMRQRTERLTAPALAGALVAISAFFILPVMAWVGQAFAGSEVWAGSVVVIEAAMTAVAIWAVPAAATGLVGGWLATRGSPALLLPPS